MRFLAILLPIALLSACKTPQPEIGDISGVKPVQLPIAPRELTIRAERLPPLTDNSMGARELDATETDIKYNEVGWRLNGLIDFYYCVREAVNNKKDPEKCLIG